MERLTTEAMAVAGDTHWPTGVAVSSHFTIRTLERYRTGIPCNDGAVARCQTALRKAAAQVGAIRLALTGLTLTPASVMLCASPADSAIERFADALAEALGDDAWFEADFDRTIWSSNLVHFTQAPQDPQALIIWVADRRHLDLGPSTHPYAQLVTWKFNGRHIVPATLGTAGLGGQ